MINLACDRCRDKAVNVCAVHYSYFKLATMKLVKMAFLLVTVLTLLQLSVGIEYSDIVALNTTCSPKDTCKSGRKGPRLDDPHDWKSRNCFCDNLCADYGDCCVDANAFVEEQQFVNTDRYECVPLTQFGSLYMRGKCMKEWEDKFIAEMCTNGTSMRLHQPFEKIRDPLAKIPDPLAVMPVTSLDSSVTYTNYYCAICNNDTSDLEIWKPYLECSTLKQYENRFKNLTADYIATNLIYKNNAWGLYINENEVEVFHTCEVYPSIPQTVSHLVRKCKVMIRNCSSDWTNETVRQLCHSYTAVRYIIDQAYRNSHCLLCNDIPLNRTACFSRAFQRFFIGNEFNSQSFAMLLDFSDRNGSNIVGSTSTCRSGEVFDPFFKKCRNVLCGKNNQEYRFGRCIDLDIPASTVESTSTPVPNIASSSNATNKLSSLLDGRDEVKKLDSVITPSVVETGSNFSNVLSSNETNNDDTLANDTESGQTLPCERFLLPTEEYTMNDNGTVMVEKYDRIYQISEYEQSDEGILVCIIQTESEKFSRIMGWVTLAGLGLSCLCLVLHLFAFLITPELRNLSGKNLASLCLVLLGAFSSFILSIFGEPGKEECFILAASMYYCFLSSFCWVNIMAFDVWRTLSLATTELRVSVGGQWHKFVIYSIYGWLLPAAAVVGVVVLDILQPTFLPPQYYPALGEYWCWFGHRKALLVFFAAPLMTIMLLNIILFILSARIIADTMGSTAKMTSCSPYHSQFKLYMRLALLMGLTWISGIVAGYLQLEPIWYIFVLLNTLQGFFIFLAFTCTRKVWHAIGCGCWRRRIAKHGDFWWARSPSSSKQGLQSTNSNVSQLSNTLQSPSTRLTSN